MRYHLFTLMLDVRNYSAIIDIEYQQLADLLL